MRVLRCDQQVEKGEGTFGQAVLLDRDGVINVDHGYVFEVEKFEWVEGVKELINELHDRGIGVGIVTNQSGIGRGYYSEKQFLDLMKWVGQDVPIDVVVYCPHAPEAGCPGRKPGTRMIEMVLNYLNCSPASALFVGDKGTDMEAAHGAGVRGHLFEGGDMGKFVQDLL